MTTFVTVQTSSNTQVFVPFTSAQNAAAAQASLDAFLNPGAAANFVKVFQPGATVHGNVTLPTSGILSGEVAQSTNQQVIYNLMPGVYSELINGATPATSTPGGSGTAIAIGSGQTNLIAGTDATTVYINQNPNGVAYLGGGTAVIENAYFGVTETVNMDGGASSVFGSGISVLLAEDTVGGTITANVGGNTLVDAIVGGNSATGQLGTVNVVANGGTVAILAQSGGNMGAVGTVSVTSADTIPGDSAIWVGALGAPVFVTALGANAYIFNTTTSENTATLFGGTGRDTVQTMDGNFTSGTFGGSILQTNTVAGAATMTAGGAGDFVLLNGANDIGNLGSGTGVLGVAYAAGDTMTAAGANDTLVASGANDVLNISGSNFEVVGSTSINSQGLSINIGGGSGVVNTFLGGDTVNFTAGSSATINGGHNSSAGSLGMSYVDQATGSGGAGNITIEGFFPNGGGTTVFDQFNMNGASLVSLTTTQGASGSGFFNDTATLSDGTQVTFLNTLGTLTHTGNLLT
jgi:hypothetical protein